MVAVDVDPAAAERADVCGIALGDGMKPIRTDSAHEAALAEAERLWGAKVGTPEGDRLDALATAIDAYETERYPMAPPIRAGGTSRRE